MSQRQAIDRVFDKIVEIANGTRESIDAAAEAKMQEHHDELVLELREWENLMNILDEKLEKIKEKAPIEEVFNE